MPDINDPQLLESFKQLFATRDDMKTIVEYQQRLYASIQQLNNNHQAIHRHVSKLTESHNNVREDANDLLRMRNDINDSLRSLSDSHAKTREEVRRATESIEYIQQEVRKIPQLESRIDRLEREAKPIWPNESSRNNSQGLQEQHLRRLENQ
jgi:chromosome segregation ATPase